MLLSTDSVTKTFAGVHALSDVSVSIRKGEIVGLIGPNGSGKSTLVNVISGVIAPTSGSVRLGEERWSRRPSHKVARCGIARTFQTTRLFAEMTVLENVEVAASCSPEVRGVTGARRAARTALEVLRLEAMAGTVVAGLPYGLQRRVELARAIAGRPHFLLLDEPAAGLHDAESDQLLDILQDLRGRLGCGMLLIDHDLRLIMRGTDRIYVLNEGRMLTEGAPEAVRRDPRVIAAYLGTDASSHANEVTDEKEARSR
jgi:ABC-type branched-subunit amino acid transport system ATPase component